MRVKRTLILLSSLLLFVSGYANALYRPNFHDKNVTQVGLYTSISNRPTIAQRDPLLAISEFRFNSRVKTVGEAINQVLQDTGYSLVPITQLPHIVQEVLKKPLPVTQRELGPITVSEALKVLIGDDVFYMRIDHLNRLVTFKLKHHSHRHKTKSHILGGKRHE